MENINLHTTLLIPTRIKAGEVFILWYCWTYEKNNWRESKFWDYQKDFINFILKQWLLEFILVIVQDSNCLEYRANLFLFQVNRKIPNNLSRK